MIRKAAAPTLMVARLSSARPECVDQSTNVNFSAQLAELYSVTGLDQVTIDENAENSGSESDVASMDSNDVV